MTETKVVRSALTCPVCLEPVKGPFPADVLYEVHVAFACCKPWLREDDDAS